VPGRASPSPTASLVSHWLQSADCSHSPERPHAHLQTGGLGAGEVGLALPIRLASTEDSVSYGARGIMGGNVNE